MNLVFIGSGYVGLVSGVMFASLGHKVACLDHDKSKIDSLKNGEIPIYEPGLKDYLTKDLQFVTSYADIDFTPDAFFICVGTPSSDDGSANLDYVFEAALDIAKIYKDVPIIVKSTVPAGTSTRLQKFLKEKRYNNPTISNPEFLSEGRAVEDFLKPDRVIIGIGDDKHKALMDGIYQQFLDKCPLLYTSRESAELIKYSSNAFLAAKIAFLNEISNLCEKVGGNIDDVSKGVGLDHRIGDKFLKTGPGFGGSCFPKDILALQYLFAQSGASCLILDATIDSNAKRSRFIVDKIKSELGELLGKSIAVLGLTFKANTDDVRSSPAISITKLLLEEGAYISAYDPKGMENAKELLNIDMAKNYLEAAKGADAILILTEWDEFKNMDYSELAKGVLGKIIFDYRNILDSTKAREAGFIIHRLGRDN